jgi:phenylalanyl-tRNA synthetase beta chain
MMHFGTPLHAYDLDTLTMPIVVRRAFEGETLTTLDGKTHKLDAEDLLICDSPGKKGARAIGIGGIMGGMETEITGNTRNILLEGAYFDPVSISRSARRHKISSEASKRFERGVDPNLGRASVYLAAKLLHEYGGAKLPENYCEVGDGLPKTIISFNYSEVERLLGIKVAINEIVEILEKVGCKLTTLSENSEIFEVEVPSWRPDLQIVADLVEEIARIHGYDKIPSALPVAPYAHHKSTAKIERNIQMRKLISTTLAARGFFEVLSYPFIALKRAKLLPSAHIELANPLAGDRPFLRTVLLQTLLETASLNVRRGHKNVRVFELGSAYLLPRDVQAQIPTLEGGELPSKAELGQIARGMPIQPKKIAGVIVNTSAPKEWFSKEAPAVSPKLNWVRAVEEAKCAVAASGACGGGELTVEQIETDDYSMLASAELFHIGRRAKLMIAGKDVGIAGQLSNSICKDFGVPLGTAAFELNLDVLSGLYPQVALKAMPVSTYPEALEDFAFVIDRAQHSDALVSVVKAAIAAISKQLGVHAEAKVKVFDIFEHEKLGVDKKSLSIAVSIRAQERTLNPSDILAFRQEIIDRVAKIGGELRK